MATLGELRGTRILDGIDRRVGPQGETSDAMVVVIRLDGVCYEFCEDAQDGYRSCLGVVQVVEAPKTLSTFEPILVRVTTRPADSAPSGDEDVLVIRRRLGGDALILEVGTENVDDYYPGFHFRWNPDGIPELPS